ncbi:MAG TPA: alpha-ketoglutarate-dependent dioxygenase AlkB [Streptosporangiaceae bacterium]|nr:alpha-ketoglutarate-dependent dioxygenase AlkB [Streptosporangiaceae bacterium]
MTAGFQASLLDAGQEFCLGNLGALRRTELAGGAWLDLLPGWVTGADDLFERLVRTVPWRAERRPMYDQVVDVPRLLSWYGKGEPLPDPGLVQAMAALDARYGRQLAEPLCTVGLCLYRDGKDSVAWHGDTSGRRVKETIVAILSLGSPRTFLLRRRPGRAARHEGSGDEASGTLRFLLGHGDLLVMGGTCQRTWQHAVPKSAKATGPRISVQFRPEGIH